MRSADLQRLAKRYLLPSLPGFAAQGAVIFAVPIGELLRAIVFQSSFSSATRVYLSVDVQPLYVPSEDLFMSVGDRLVGPSHSWTIDAADPGPVMEEIRRAILDEGLPFLDSVPDVPALIHRLIRRRVEKADRGIHLLEALAYSHVWVNDFAEAVTVLDEVQEMTSRFPVEPAWPHEVAARCAQVQAALAQDPNAAQALLRQWRRETIAALRLEKWALPD